MSRKTPLTSWAGNCKFKTLCTRRTRRYRRVFVAELFTCARGRNYAPNDQSDKHILNKALPAASDSCVGCFPAPALAPRFAKCVRDGRGPPTDKPPGAPHRPDPFRVCKAGCLGSPAKPFPLGV